MNTLKYEYRVCEKVRQDFTKIVSRFAWLSDLWMASLGKRNKGEENEEDYNKAKTTKK